MLSVDPANTSTSDFHRYLLGAVAPRPIAFASTIDDEGKVNLSPFSFFNAFSANPPILVFSPARRVRDNTTKHTLENVQSVPEVVINIVSFDLVEQMSLTSTEYDKNTNEFVKSGLTQLTSEKVRPPRVEESKVSFECKVREVIALGDQGGAGNLVICEVLLAHIQEDILDDQGRIDPRKLDAVARLGGDWYCRANGEALFQIAKPLQKKGIGVDKIPIAIRSSEILSGNDLGRLGNTERLPTDKEVEDFAKEPEVSAILEYFADNSDSRQNELHKLAKIYLDHDEVWCAWMILLQV
ncbi:MAG: flavin reductase family protein [Cyclobacteriaceae bacterium]|nr:flavin reductase family protein [Cyclobacteriaceae bacterium HetDA_MAG_MS6]